MGEIGSEFSATDLQQMLELSDALLVVTDLKGTVLRLSSRWTTLLGRPAEAILGRHYGTFMHPDDVEPSRQRLRARLSGTPYSSPHINRLQTSQGDYRWLHWAVRVDVDGDLAWFVARDITAERAATVRQELVADLGRLALEGATAQRLMQAAADGLAAGLGLPYTYTLELVDDRLLARSHHGLTVQAGTFASIPVDSGTASGTVVLTGQSQALTDTPGHDDEFVYGLPDQPHGALAVLIGSTDRIWGVLGGRYDGTHAFDDDEVRYAEQLAHLVAVALESLQMQDTLRHMATHDGLTGLPNRDLLRERIHAGLSVARRSGQSVALLLCDLDQFKDVNDSLGHLAGDLVLQQLGQRLVATVGDQGTVARLGGDEFAIFVSGPKTSVEVLGVADAVVEAMRKPFTVPGMDVALSTSIGISLGPGQGRDAATLLRHADVAMYRAKSARLGWALYDPALDAATTERLALTSDLRNAIHNRELSLAYQPIVDLLTGEVRSLEALCRWNHPQRGQVAPTTFIALAEQTGSVLALTRWVVEEAVRQCQLWRKDGLELPCAVNLSMAAVVDLDAARPLMDALLEAAGLLTVEVTESWLVDDHGQQVLHLLAAGGVHLAIDDFGTGFSSLASLRSFPAAQLKIDKTFLADLDADPRGADVLHAISELGKSLGLRIVAEGVEDQSTADRLLAAGVQLGQGLLWSGALPASDLELWLEQHPPGAAS